MTYTITRISLQCTPKLLKSFIPRIYILPDSYVYPTRVHAYLERVHAYPNRVHAYSSRVHTYPARVHIYSDKNICPSTSTHELSMNSAWTQHELSMYTASLPLTYNLLMIAKTIFTRSVYYLFSGAVTTFFYTSNPYNTILRPLW